MKSTSERRNGAWTGIAWRMRSGLWVVYKKCVHSHKTPVAAKRCADKMNREVGESGSGT